MTRSFSLQRGAGGVQALFEKVGRYIEILVVFASDMRPPRGSGIVLEGVLSPEEDQTFNLILRLVYEVVMMNQVMMKFETDEKKTKMTLSLRFPVERRRVFFYETISINPPTHPPSGSISNVPFL